MNKLKVGDKVRLIKNPVDRSCFAGFYEFFENIELAYELKLKKGDRVRLIDDTNMAAVKGTMATVTEDYYEGWLKVKWDKGHETRGIYPQDDGVYDFNKFELVKDEEIFGKFETENDAKYKISLADWNGDVNIKIKKQWIWDSDDLRELAAHLERVADHLDNQE